MRLTAACPAEMLSDANHLTMALSFGPADGRTYIGLNWQDAAGNLYAAASFVTDEGWPTAATRALERPAWDKTTHVNMTGAGRAQLELVMWLGGSDPVPQAAAGNLTVVAGEDGPAALAAMGLTPVPATVL